MSIYGWAGLVVAGAILVCVFAWWLDRRLNDLRGDDWE